MDNHLAPIIGRELTHELCKALEVLGHCLTQLSDEQVWHRPAPDMNSIGHLLLHLTGNVRQWLVSGLSDAPDRRDRPAEFAERGPIPRADLWAALRSAVEEGKAALAAQGADAAVP